MSHGGDIYNKNIDLDFSVNLNPLGVSDEMLKAIFESLKRCTEYPDLNQSILRKNVAINERLEPENIYGGCGASELIPAIIRSVNPKKALVFTPCYTGYNGALESSGVQIVYRDTKKENEFELAVDDLDAITDDIDLIFLCDPVNPTGRNIDDDIIRNVIKKAKQVGAAVILDESFYLMSDKGERKPNSLSIKLLTEFDNLYILRSFTKLFSVPGIRAGIVISSKENINGIINQLPEWNLPVTSEAVILKGYELTKDGKFLKETMESIKSGREYLKDNLKKFGLKVYETDSSYILFEGPENLKDCLLNKGILIRDCSDIVDLGSGYYRTAVKNSDENKRFISVIGECLV